MKIEVTGCNNCPFGFKGEFEHLCSYNLYHTDDPIIDTGNGNGDYRADKPYNCPITLNGGEITIKTKTE